MKGTEYYSAHGVIWGGRTRSGYVEKIAHYLQLKDPKCYTLSFVQVYNLFNMFRVRGIW